MQQKSQTEYRTFTICWLMLLVVTAWTSQGWLQPDEHARVLEPAHQIAYGFATLPWEMRDQPAIVSFLLGVLLSPVLMLTKLFGATGLTEAFAARLFTGLLASTRLIALLRIFQSLKLNPDRYFKYLVICALAVFGPYMFVRTSQENYAATALIWAFALHFDIVSDQGKNKIKLIGFAILLGVATSARLQVGPAAAGIGLYVLARTGKQIIPYAIFGLILGLLPLAIVDYIYTGTPFTPAWHYLQYALSDEQGGHMWGTQPWWWYFGEFFTAWYPPLTILLLVPLILGLRFNPAISAVFIPFTLIHIILNHKETRYFAPMIPFMQLATFIGWEWLEGNRPDIVSKVLAWPRTSKFFFYTFIVAGVIGGAVQLNTSPEMYDRLGELLNAKEVDHYTYIGNTRSRPAQFYLKTPGMKPEGKLSLDDVLAGATIPSGWLVIYATDPVLFDKVSDGCDVKYVGLSPIERSFLKLLPEKTPIRRRINAIIHCEKSRVLEKITD
jgi:hypothetical protein